MHQLSSCATPDFSASFHECKGEQAHLFCFSSSRGKNEETVQSNRQVTASALSAGPQLSRQPQQGVSVTLQGSCWLAVSIQPRRTHGTFVTRGPARHTDTLCKAKVLHLRDRSAARDLCAPPPCQQLGIGPKAGLSK